MPAMFSVVVNTGGEYTTSVEYWKPFIVNLPVCYITIQFKFIIFLEVGKLSKDGYHNLRD